MLKNQRNVQFTGGLEAARLKDWHVDLLVSIKPKQIFFAYDTPQDFEPLVEAGKKLLNAGFTKQSHCLRCYVLIGYPKDTFALAHSRLTQARYVGFTPMAMLWRDVDGQYNHKWKELQRQWARPALIYATSHCGR